MQLKHEDKSEVLSQDVGRARQTMDTKSAAGAAAAAGAGAAAGAESGPWKSTTVIVRLIVRNTLQFLQIQDIITT